MTFLAKKIPPPLVAILCAGMMAAIASVTPALILNDEWRMSLVIGFIVLGISIDVASLWTFWRVKTTINPMRPESSSSLVVVGIYRYSRNPMYVGLAIFLTAWACYLSAPIALFGVIGFVVYLTYFQILPEEQALLALFGAEYREYLSTVRRWI